MKKTLYLAFLLLFTAACTAQPQPTQNVDTIVQATLTALAQESGNPQASQPAPTQASETPQPEPAASATPSTGGMDVSYMGTTFTIPSGLASGTQNEVVPQANDPNVPFEVNPAYTKIVLQGYPLQGTLFEPQVLVYPVREYAQMSDSARATIDNLKNILAAQRTSVAEPVPLLPLLNAAQVFHAQDQFLSFQNGSGIRFITQYDQAPLPINNTEIFYTFQGLTSDGSYYISVILPVNVPFLPAENRVPSITPADGVPFPEDVAKFPDYLFSVMDRLNRTDTPFNPPLDSLDALVQSISVTGQ